MEVNGWFSTQDDEFRNLYFHVDGRSLPPSED